MKNNNNETRPAPVKDFCANCAQFGTTCHGASLETPWTNCAMKKPIEEPRAIMDRDYTALIIKREERAEMRETTAAQLDAAARTIREYTRIKEEAEALITSAQDVIKRAMEERGQDTITGSDYRATWKTINATKFDSAAMEKDFPGMKARYTIPNPYRRFTLN